MAGMNSIEKKYLHKNSSSTYYSSVVKEIELTGMKIKPPEKFRRMSTLSNLQYLWWVRTGNSTSTCGGQKNMLAAQRRGSLMRQPDQEWREREAYAFAAEAHADLSTYPITSSPLSLFRGEHGEVAGGGAVASWRPSSARIAPARSSLARSAGCAASIRQDSGSVPVDGRQGFELFRRRREGTARRRRVLMGIAQPGIGFAADSIALEDENQRLKVELQRVTEESRKSRAHRMRLESELLRAEGKVDTLLVELDHAPRNRDIRLLNAMRGDVEKCALVRTLVKRNEQLQELLARREKDLEALKRMQEWSAMKEMTAATEEYFVEIQRLQRLLARHHCTADVQDVSTRNTGNGTGSKFDPRECIDVADLGQSNESRRADKDHRMEHDDSNQNVGRCRRRVSYSAHSTGWRVDSGIRNDPTAVETSTNHRDADRVVVDEKKPAADDEGKWGQHERIQPLVGGLNTEPDSIRGSGTPHTRVPQRGQNRGPITTTRSGSPLHLTKKYTRSTSARARLRLAMCTSPVCSSRPSSELDRLDYGAEEIPTKAGFRSQPSRQTVSPVPWRGNLRSRRRRRRPLSAPPKGRKVDQEGQASALLQCGHQVPWGSYSSHLHSRARKTSGPRVRPDSVGSRLARQQDDLRAESRPRFRPPYTVRQI